MSSVQEYSTFIYRHPYEINFSSIKLISSDKVTGTLIDSLDSFIELAFTHPSSARSFVSGVALSLCSFLFLALGFAPFALFEADLLCLQWRSTRGHQ